MWYYNQTVKTNSYSTPMFAAYDMWFVLRPLSESSVRLRNWKISWKVPDTKIANSAALVVMQLASRDPQKQVYNVVLFGGKIFIQYQEYNKT